MHGTTAKTDARDNIYDGLLDAYFATLAEDARAGFEPAEGIVAGTRVATEFGWRAVEEVMPGDMVTTRDHGPQMVTAITRGQVFSNCIPCPSEQMPMAIPGGALGNLTPMVLLPGQPVLVTCSTADAPSEGRHALVPAAALEGYRGISRVSPHQRVEIVVLQFDRDEVVYANGMGLIQCRGVSATASDGYPLLPMQTARRIVAGMIESEAEQA